ncbi:MAG: hypothetical protein HZC03_02540 [Candidatus Lloydbacteria bacterium]|nr:hypothetical protein [Candidatus Lloydbacteria bacterium]
MSSSIFSLRSRLPLLTSVVLFCGTIFAWYTTYTDFSRFFTYGGSWLRFSETIYPHPATTPCFYGAFAFLAALVWSLLILCDRIESRKHEQQKYLVWFLTAGNLFAWTNALSQIVRFYTAGPGEKVGCSGVLITNPFATPCFYGASLFLLSLLIAFLAFYFAEKKEIAPEGDVNV